MTIRERRVGEVVVLSIDGDITMAAGGATRLADTVRGLLQREHRILLDLGRVRFVDSAGLGELVQCAAAARTRGARFKLLGVNQRLSDLLVVMKLLTAFECFDREADAIASLTAGYHANAH
jgi:anti-sigma B factor antagonist